MSITACASSTNEDDDPKKPSENNRSSKDSSHGRVPDLPKISPDASHSSADFSDSSSSSSGSSTGHRSKFLSYFSELFQRLRPLLKSIAREHAQSVPDCKVDESDIVQTSFVKVIENYDQFQGKTTGQWRAWLTAIVRNTARDARRFHSQEKRAHTNEEHGSHVLADLVDKSIKTPSRTLDEMESREKLDAAMATLSIQDQQLVRWRMFHVFSYKEIASRLKITEPTARRRCAAAVDALRNELMRLGA